MNFPSGLAVSFYQNTAKPDGKFAFVRAGRGPAFLNPHAPSCVGR